MAKNLHSPNTGAPFLQTIAYTYNERGWLLSSSAPLFQMQLQYNLNPAGVTGFIAQYNGNIASQVYTSFGQGTKNFNYTYDYLNRLVNGTGSDGFSETGISYDLNGNIMSLNRYQAGAPIDQLGYTYNSTNQVQTIVDGSGNNAGLNSGTMSYAWNVNGNLLSNTNTAVTTQNKSFTYNMLNLPQTAITATGGTDTYTYDATGQKLRKVNVNGSTTVTTDYISGIQYNNSTTNIGFIQTEEGKAVLQTNGSYDYTYYLGDNLGNTRITFDTQTSVAVMQQQDDYYPFGMEILRTSPIPNPKNEYLYNRKELQEELGQYDYGARFYDPVIGRWTSVDPYAEKYKSYSAYNFCINNPLKYIDLGGDTIMFNDYTIDHTGLSQTQALINSGLGEQYATIGANGALSLNVTSDEISNMTDEQKGFYNVINGVNSDTRGNVVENITQESSTLVGEFDSSEIDITDVKAFGNGAGADQFSTFGHEIKEQQSKQIDKKDFPAAHEDGKKAESEIKGATRTSDDPSKMTTNGDRTTSGTYDINYTDNKTGKVTKVSMQIDHNNVKKVDRTSVQ